MYRLYLYLASRSKRGIKLLTVIQSNQQVNSEIYSLEALDLPQIWEFRLANLINENISLYEPRMETAPDYTTLKERLKDRGFTNIPNGAIPLLQFGNFGTLPVANTSSAKVVTTMLRKQK